MTAFDRQRLVAALLLLVMALFVSANAPFAGRWRRALRAAAIAGFAVLVVVVLVDIVSWLSG